MVDIRRLGPGDEVLAREMFATMATVFEEDTHVLHDEYVQQLLRREDFWAVVAREGDLVLGGITAHALPMTRSQSTELFIYDLAVRADWQRRGIGRALVGEGFACRAPLDFDPGSLA